MGFKKAFKAVSTGGLSLLGGGLGGSTENFAADPVAKDLIELRQRGAGLQKRGLSILEKQDPTQGVMSDVAREEKIARQSGQDEIMRAKQMAAQRGLQGTSIGVGAEQQASRNVADRLGAIRGSIGSRLRDANQQYASNLLSTGSGLVAQGGPIRMRDESVRKKGMLGTLLGGVAGGIATGGSPQGIQTGSSLGSLFNR